MNLAISPTVKALAVKIEGQDNPITMLKAELALVCNDDELTEIAGATTATVAFGKWCYRKIQPLVSVGKHDLVLDGESMRVRVELDVHEIVSDDDDGVTVVLRCTAPFAPNSAALLYLAEHMGQVIECRLEAAQQELPLENATTAMVKRSLRKMQKAVGPDGNITISSSKTSATLAGVA